MDFLIAGIIGVITLGIGLFGAYLGGVLGWLVIERHWVEVMLNRRQWLLACGALGFVSALGGGLVGADLAAIQYVPWMTERFSQTLSSLEAFALILGF